MLHITSLDDGLDIFKALGSDVRIEIIKLLIENKEMNMNELAACAKADAQCHPYPCASSYDTGVDLLCPADALPWAVLSCGASGGACPFGAGCLWNFGAAFPRERHNRFSG